MATETIKVELPFRACLECPLKDLEKQGHVFVDGVMYREIREYFHCANETVCHNAVMRYLNYDEKEGQHD